MEAIEWVVWFEDLRSEDVGRVGGKNSALGELIGTLTAAGVQVPGGFAVTAAAYRAFLDHNDLVGPIGTDLQGLDVEDVNALESTARRIRERILAGSFPPALEDAIRSAYAELSARAGVEETSTAVRSSATAEDLPTASFAGQQETFLHVKGADNVIEATRKCIASLFTARAVSYRTHNGFGHLDVALSVGVQQMVRSDVGSSGVIFTLDPDSGHQGVVYLTAAWGLGETVVQGRVVPDGFYVHKDTVMRSFSPIVSRLRGSKRVEMVLGPDHRPYEREVEPERRQQWALQDDDVLQLARWAVKIEQHFTEKAGHPMPMDIEWARDGETGRLYIVQARPETVHAQEDKGAVLRRWKLHPTEEPVLTGLAVGDQVAYGAVRVVASPEQMDQVQDGDVLVAEATDPDWEPVMKRCAAIVTERGGRTSHAAIVAREHGLPAVVGAEGAMSALAGLSEVTVSCAAGSTGRIYAGHVPSEVEEVPVERPAVLRTKVMVNAGDPETAFELARLPVDGVGLARMEFILSALIGLHPNAALHPEALDDATRAAVAEHCGGEDPVQWYTDRLAEGMATLAAAFHPRPVIVRFSDFKSNEYAGLLGGSFFEPHEENPMIGWRGASRYYDDAFRTAFLLEVAAVKRVREQMGLDNLHVMVPFCRTPEEGRKVLGVLEQGGLPRGSGGLKVWVMAEIPANVLLAAEFAAAFDGFSIGSNDLTQLVYGVDRDSAQVAHLFDDDGAALHKAVGMLLETTRALGTPVGICGQAPSDHPAFAAFLVANGISSISLTPDAVARGLQVVAEAEGA